MNHSTTWSTIPFVTCQWFDAKCTVSKRRNLVFERAFSEQKALFQLHSKRFTSLRRIGEEENSGGRRGVCKGTSLVCIGLVFRGKCGISNIFTNNHS